MATATPQGAPSNAKVTLSKRVSRLLARIERIKLRLGRGETKKVDALLNDELKMREAELTFKAMQLQKM